MLHADVVQILITVIKWLENHLNVFKRSNDPWNLPNFHMTIVLVTLNIGKNLKAVRGSYLPFVIKHGLFPLGTTSLLVSCFGLWGVCVQTFVKHANFFTASSWWHDKTSTKVSCVSDFFYFFGIKMPCHSMHTYACVHVVRQICLKIPSNLLHMELTRTQVHKHDFSNHFG